jgi:hypothetical protein
LPAALFPPALFKLSKSLSRPSTHQPSFLEKPAIVLFDFSFSLLPDESHVSSCLKRSETKISREIGEFSNRSRSAAGRLLESRFLDPQGKRRWVHSQQLRCACRSADLPFFGGKTTSWPLERLRSRPKNGEKRDLQKRKIEELEASLQSATECIDAVRNRPSRFGEEYV